MDYERTKKYYTDLKTQYPQTTIKYEPNGDEIEYFKWIKRCQDINGTWHQDPKHPELVYPLKSVNCIIREMTRDGEKLKSRQRWIGLNAYLDEQPINRDDPEVYIETLFGKRRIQDPNNRDNIITEPAGIASQKTKYLIDFTPENLDKLWEMREDGFCYLVVSDKRRDVAPREVLSYEDFRNKPHEELMKPPIPAQANETATRAPSSKKPQ